ncbi:MAG TPA: prepilin-type N-terminal cleavage/methylation domain-containing protein [Planctomycetota bacterium]
MVLRKRDGFTLIEVMLALAILAMAVVVVLDQRVDVVREAGSARDARTMWMLASRKIAELELDRELWLGTGGTAAGNFGDLDAEYAPFTWEYVAAKEMVEAQDPALLKPGDKPKEIFRLVLAISMPGLEKPLVVEAMLPVQTPPAAPEAAPPGAPPPGGAFPPPPETPK